jgi:hypothetical protein
MPNREGDFKGVKPAGGDASTVMAWNGRAIAPVEMGAGAPAAGGVAQRHLCTGRADRNAQQLSATVFTTSPAQGGCTSGDLFSADGRQSMPP